MMNVLEKQEAIIHLLKFAIATLCPDCRRQISDQIRVALLETA